MTTPSKWAQYVELHDRETCQQCVSIRDVVDESLLSLGQIEIDVSEAIGKVDFRQAAFASRVQDLRLELEAIKEGSTP